MRVSKTIIQGALFSLLLGAATAAQGADVAEEIDSERTQRQRRARNDQNKQKQGARMHLLEGKASTQRRAKRRRPKHPAVSTEMAEVVLRASADQMMMLSPFTNEGLPPLGGLQPGQRPLESATMGAQAFTPEALFTRLYGEGRAQLVLENGAITVRWTTANRRWTLGTVDKASQGPRFTPSARALAHRNAMVGKSILQQVQKLQRQGAVDTRQAWQPESWLAPPEQIHVLHHGVANVLYQLASQAQGDPLLASMAPMPETHFSYPAHADRHERDRLQRAWRDWRSHVRHSDITDAKLVSCQREGAVRPLRLMWKDGQGAHSIALETRMLEGKLVRWVSYRTAPHRMVQPRPRE